MYDKIARLIEIPGANIGIRLVGSQIPWNTVAAGMYANNGDGSYNGITKDGDIALIYHGTTMGDPKGFVIAPWSASSSGIRLDNNGNVGIGTGSPSARLDIAGRTKTQILEITGGSDLAEPFEISHEEILEPGSVVIIDDEHTGKLKLSDRAYDRRVAGVVSGAGGINTGLTLNQTELTKTGQNVALAGRVYVKATTANGVIKPGDRLVTSSIPGLCMKATDPSRCDGAVIGKAMSTLEKSEGLVLVLVNLQ